MTFVNVLKVYLGSDGTATTALYARLEALGPIGTVAINLFRAQKASERAKVYRGRFKGVAYDKKQWSVDNLCKVLAEHAEASGIVYGWAEDDAQPFHRWVLYVDLPTGQVSFHAAARGDGPDYSGAWDGIRQQGPTRICRWIAERILED